MNNKKYILLRKMFPLIFCLFYLMFSWSFADYIEYTSYKNNYILVSGNIEEFDYKAIGKLGQDYSIINIDFNGSLYKVKVTRRHKDKIGQVVQIAINPLNGSEKIQEGVWTKPFLPYGSILFVLCIGATAILYYMFRKVVGILNKQQSDEI